MFSDLIRLTPTKSYSQKTANFWWSFSDPKVKQHRAKSVLGWVTVWKIEFFFSFFPSFWFFHSIFDHEISLQLTCETQVRILLNAKFLFSSNLDIYLIFCKNLSHLLLLNLKQLEGFRPPHLTVACLVFFFSFLGFLFFYIFWNISFYL